MNGASGAGHSCAGAKKERLRLGFSTGTAAVAAARAALRMLLAAASAPCPECVAVRLPSGVFLPVPVAGCRVEGARASGRVIKDAGDDPDVTDKAEILAHVSVRRVVAQSSGGSCDLQPRESGSGIFLGAGRGVGTVTKPGLPVPVGEPAINPTPRAMFSVNLSEELAAHTDLGSIRFSDAVSCAPAGPPVWVPLSSATADAFAGIAIDVEIEVPRGEELARRTLNPRLGILGGISILGTTGIVRPFSNQAYEETIRSALSVAAANGRAEVVLSTGGKSERLAAGVVSGLAPESFVQIADFFGFSVREAVRFGFRSIVHSAFFGKVVKMAQGHEYTHAHSAPLDLKPLARMAEERGYDPGFCASIAGANTARHALDLLKERNGADVIEAAGRLALERSFFFAGGGAVLRLLLFDYDGRLLLDLARTE
jgi:cobalt-precorrin-5B (C1)-methyltransferase